MVVAMRHYALIAGYPGTGKTRTVAALLEDLASRGLRVLLCAHTHAALDHVLIQTHALAGIIDVAKTTKVEPSFVAASSYDKKRPRNCIENDNWKGRR